MRESERGYTLIETVVAVAILAILLAAGGVWLLGRHPGSLAQATDDYDAAVASARAVAATSGNGATLVFLPRRSGALSLPGFELRVYSGRPTAANAVQPTTAMPVTSDAAVSEATLGKPPFAIFVGASGSVSGPRAYPAIAADGSASFPAIATEPACPAGGFLLTFVSAERAQQTRALPCIAALASDPTAANPSPTPNAPLVTPAALVYHWPADAEQTFVATEWGYTHWFASDGRFRCGNGVARFPDVLPSPYAPPYSAAEGLATPLPPPDDPYSYPNSGGASMEDAPAPFRLDPAAAGLCSAGVHDEYSQSAATAVQVMGWLTATYAGSAYTHVTSPALTLPASALAHVGSAVTIALGKSYDSQPLQIAAELDSTCASYVSAAAVGGTTPSSPSAAPATASLLLTVTALPKSPVTCGGVIYDQYPNSKSGEGVPFNATLAPLGPLVAWPPAEKIALAGSLGTVSATFAGAGKPCTAVAYSLAANGSFASPLADATAPPNNGALLAQTDDNGCILDGSGQPISGAAVAYQAGFAGNFGDQINTCDGYVNLSAAWLPVATGPGPGGQMLGIMPVASTPSETPCDLLLLGAAPNGAHPVSAEVVLGSVPLQVKATSSCKILNQNGELACTGTGKVAYFEANVGVLPSCGADFALAFGDENGNNLPGAGPGANAIIPEPAGSDSASWGVSMLAAAQAAVAQAAAGTGYDLAGQPELLTNVVTKGCP